MCAECGCGLPTEAGQIHAEPTSHSHGPEGGQEHSHPHDHGSAHHHPHYHGHSHGHEHTLAEGARLLEVRQAILQKNDRLAERNRGFFQARDLLALNVVSSPGSGKTTLVQRTLEMLRGRLNAGVIVGDLATSNDALRLRATGAPVVQINTGTLCHLDAEMVARALKQLDLGGLGLLVIENVGNLVCPAAYDLGEHLRVVLLSVTEGEDKPLKYPPMFQSAAVVVISKRDLAQACDYEREAALANVRAVAPRARVFELSAKTGAGLEAWTEFLVEQRRAWLAGEHAAP